MMRDIGALFSGEESMLSPHELTEIHDAMIFIDQTTRARPVKREKAERKGPKVRLDD